MRTTLNVDDDVLAHARALAAARGISLGAAISVLARRGLRVGHQWTKDAFPTFEVPDDAPVFDLRDVCAAEDADDAEAAARHGATFGRCSR